MNSLFLAIARQSLEVALFKTYSVPSISKILAATNQFSNDTAKRVEDTELILVNRFFTHLINCSYLPSLTQICLTM